MGTHLIRRVDPNTRAPVVDHTMTGPDGQDIPAAFYFIECDRCGLLNQRGLTRRAAQVRADGHRCG